MSCFYKKHLGVECPGCGIQRSLVHLLKGEFAESFQMYPALLTTILMFTFLIVHLVFKVKNGHKVLLTLFILNAIIMISSYVLKQF
jgi:uncharacterized membrane protein